MTLVELFDHPPPPPTKNLSIDTCLLPCPVFSFNPYCLSTTEEFLQKDTLWFFIWLLPTNLTHNITILSIIISYPYRIISYHITSYQNVINISRHFTRKYCCVQTFPPQKNWALVYCSSKLGSSHHFKCIILLLKAPFCVIYPDIFNMYFAMWYFCCCCACVCTRVTYGSMTILYT